MTLSTKYKETTIVGLNCPTFLIHKTRKAFQEAAYLDII